MSTMTRKKDETRENVLEKVDTLFSLINTLPLNVQEEALSEIKERLRNKINKFAENTYSFESEESNTTCTPDPFSEELDENGFATSNDTPVQTQGSFCKLQNCSSPTLLKQCEVKLKRINIENTKFEKPTFLRNEAVLKEQTCQYSESRRHREEQDSICNASSGSCVCHHCAVQHFKCAKHSCHSVTKSGIEKHIATHTKKRNYICDICDKSYFTNSKLKDHINNVHHKTIREVCEICGFATHSKDIMRRHRIVKHTNQETFQCPVCSATIKQKGTFLVHMRIHTGERPCSCKVCSKTFRSRSQLASHMRMHREGEFVCEMCGHRFRSRSHLQRHSVIHTGAKPFSCHLCSYECNVRTNITKHVRSVHGLAHFTLKKLPSKPSSKDRDTTASKRGLIAAEECLKKFSAEQGSEITVQELQQKASKSQGSAGSIGSQNAEARLCIDKAKETENSSSATCLPKSSPSKNFVSSTPIEDILSSSKEKSKNASRDILLDAMKLLTSVSADDESTLNDASFLHRNDQTFEIDSSAADNLNMYVIQVFYNETASNSL